ncbi:hypothetical protein Tco_1392364 [Tanacetum coccineum]
MEFESAQSNTTAKLPILKLGEYEMWVIRIKQYFQVQDYALWEVIENGEDENHDENANIPPPVPPTQQAPHTLSTIKLPIMKKGEFWLEKERERKVRTTLLMSIPEDHLAKFHKITDAKEMWEAIKSRFGGNDKSKKMQKYILKQQFESFSVSNSEGLHKGYESGPQLDHEDLEQVDVGPYVELKTIQLIASLSTIERIEKPLQEPFALGLASPYVG